MQRFSALSLLGRALGGHRGWTAQWRRATPKAAYDALIVGGGGHGLGAAYYLASEHRLSNVAVLEKGWIGGGNTGRNTTIIRSNYLFAESAALYDHALKLWEHLSQALNYNVMLSQRGVMMLAHTVHDMQVIKRHVHANRANGVDNEWLTPAAGQGLLSAAEYKRPALPGAGCGAAASRRHRATRRRRVGLRARSRRARRRHHRELRSHRYPARCAGRGRSGGDHARHDPCAARSAWLRPGTPAP